MPVKRVCSPTEMLGGLPPQCSSLYEERYILPSQTLNSQGSSPVQETHPLLGEWKVSTRNSPRTRTLGFLRATLPLSGPTAPLIPITGGWEAPAMG